MTSLCQLNWPAPQAPATPDEKKKKPFVPLPPSAWGMTPEQRLERLYTYFAFVKDSKGVEAEKRERYLIEIEAIENALNKKGAKQ